MHWWVEWKDGTAGCMYGREADVKLRADEMHSAHGDVTSIRCLPYPANPQIGPVAACPPFCYSPEKCKGKTHTSIEKV